MSQTSQNYVSSPPPPVPPIPPVQYYNQMNPYYGASQMNSSQFGYHYQNYSP